MFTSDFPKSPDPFRFDQGSITGMVENATIQKQHVLRQDLNDFDKAILKAAYQDEAPQTLSCQEAESIDWQGVPDKGRQFDKWLTLDVSYNGHVEKQQFLGLFKNVQILGV